MRHWGRRSDAPLSPAQNAIRVEKCATTTPGRWWMSSLPFLISQPGRYYLSRDLTQQNGANAITIQSSDVTLDLLGFTLHGTARQGDGVFVSAASTGIRIELGNIRGFFNGIDATNATFSRLSD